LKLNGTHQLLLKLMMLIHWAEAYILYRKTDALVVASKETELEVNVEKLSNCSCLEITM